jgi:hypothetical protein
VVALVFLSFNVVSKPHQFFNFWLVRELIKEKNVKTSFRNRSIFYGVVVRGMDPETNGAETNIDLPHPPSSHI